MNVLVVAPHPDDEAIGCGGILCRHADRGDRATVSFLTSGELGLKHLPRDEAWRVREGEARRAAEILAVSEVWFLRRADWLLADGVAEAAALLGPVLRQEKPDRIYLPQPHEEHPDHRAAAAIVGAALAAHRPDALEIFGYEVWTPLSAYDHVEDITGVMARKLRAVRCYQSQLPGFFYDRAVRGLNQFRGCLAGHCRYAEVFRRLTEKDLTRETGGEL